MDAPLWGTMTMIPGGGRGRFKKQPVRVPAPPPPPAPPVLVAGAIQAAAGDGKVTITETAAPQGGAGPITRTLYRSTTSGQLGTLVGVVTLPYEDQGRTNGQAIYHTVRYSSGAQIADSNQTTSTPQAAGGGDGIFFQTDFSQDTLGQPPSVGNDDFAWSYGGGAGNYVTNEIAPTPGGRSLRFNCTGVGDYNNERRFWLPQGYRDLWIRCKRYFPTGSEGIPGVGKFEPVPSGTSTKYLRLWQHEDMAVHHAGYDDPEKVGMETRPSSAEAGATYLYAMCTIVYGPGNWAITQCTPALDPFVNNVRRGVWLDVLIHIKSATAPGADDGIFQTWIDGALGPSTTTMPLYLPDGVGWNRGYLDGYSNGGVKVPSASYMADLLFSTVDPR